MRRLKASTDYGTRFILYLAETNELKSSKQASEDMAIPQEYLIQLAHRMSKAGIIESQAGRSGGYKLAKSPDKLSVTDLLDLFEKYGVETRKEVSLENASEEVKRVMKMHDDAVRCLISFTSLITVQDLLDVAHGEADLEQLIAMKMIEAGNSVLEK